MIDIPVDQITSNTMENKKENKKNKKIIIILDTIIKNLQIQQNRVQQIIKICYRYNNLKSINPTMEHTVNCKIHIRGEIIQLKVKDSFDLHQIIEYLKQQDIIPDSTKDQNISIKNYYGGTLDLSCKLLQIPQRNQYRQITISYPQANKQKLGLVKQHISYLLSSQQIFKQSCISILEDTLQKTKQKLILLYHQQKISKQLFILLIQLKKKIYLHHQFEQQFNIVNQIFDNINQQKKFANILQTNQKQLIHTLPAINKFYQSLYGKAIGFTSSVTNKIYKAKTFQQNEFKDQIKTCNTLLINAIQAQTKKQVSQVRSVYFDYQATLANRDFLPQILEKNNFLLIFSTLQGDALFGIFSPNKIPKGQKRIKSEGGFFFSVAANDTFKPKPKQCLWVSSNVQLKLGDASSISMGKSNKGQNLVLKKKKQLGISFDLKQKKDVDIFKTEQKNIKIKSFQILTIHFQNQ